MNTNENERSVASNLKQNNLIVDDRFLVGKSIFLRPPNIDEDILNGNWHSWFNDVDITKYLTHGVYPVRREDQAKFIAEVIKSPTTLLLCVISKETNKHLGVISLKNIDLINRVAEINIVMGKNRISGSPALEAMALLTKHAFDRFNLEMLYSGQHESLWKWLNTLSLIGFRIDGYRKNSGIRDRAPYGIFLTSVSAEDFYFLQVQRGGDVLGSSTVDLVKNRLRTNPKALFQRAIDELNSEWSNKS
ncbi:MAG: GNAT family protein [Betaproteobacteria bacterium]